MAETERERQHRVADQLITMHAVLRDRYNLRSLLLSCALLTASTALCALVFVDDVHFRAWHLDPSLAKDLIGLFSVLLVAGSIVELRADWAERARTHDHAVRRLFQLTALYRTAPAGDASAVSSLADEYKRTMNDIAPIPEREFNPLKAHHLFKVELSKRISENPKAWLWLMRLKLRWEGATAVVARDKEAKDGEVQR